MYKRQAQESARSVAEQAAREVSEGVSQRNVARSLELNREELLKELETQIDQQSKANLTLLTANPEFKQQLVQTVRSGIQPVIETIARETAERAILQAGANLGASAESLSLIHICCSALAPARSRALRSRSASAS